LDPTSRPLHTVSSPNLSSWTACALAFSRDCKLTQCSMHLMQPKTATRAWTLPKVRLSVFSLLNTAQQAELLLLSEAGFEEAVKAFYRDVGFEEYERMVICGIPLVDNG